jgi:thiamine-phosphate pyrophosphorylase
LTSARFLSIEAVPMRGLYAIVDVATLTARGLDPLLFADAVLAAAPAALQLRAKDLPPRETLALLRALASRCHRAKVPLVANDRPDLAALAGCDMVHVGQDDMSIDRVRRLAPRLGIGVSTHTPEQLSRALAARPTYVAYGPVFETATKANPDAVVGMSGLREAHALTMLASTPLVAIGGVRLEHARDVAECAEAAAVVAGLLPPVAGVARGAVDLMREVTARSRAFQAALGRGGSVRAEAIA